MRLHLPPSAVEGREFEPHGQARRAAVHELRGELHLAFPHPVRAASHIAHGQLSLRRIVEGGVLRVALRV